MRGVALVNALTVCDNQYRGWDSRTMRVGRDRDTIANGRPQPSVVKNHAPGFHALSLAAFSRSFWRMAALTAAGAIGTTSYAQAAVYWSDSSDPGYSRSGPSVAPRRPNPRRHAGKKITAPEKEAAKPQGPLIIAISIQQQKLRIYDANGFYAETPISTGMPGHSTPMGVFSVIQKQKLHHSNIYSGAPMPFMQRITWSGIAIHAGVLPGYPASHGCIRMPMAFAVKMYGWTKMGARVVVTPGGITPESFSHPLLAALKVAPQPVAAAEPPTDPKVDAKPEKTASADDGVKLAAPSAAAPLREQTHTADAGATLPETKAPITMSDASSSGAGAPPRQEIVAATDRAPETIGDAAAKPAETASSEDKPSETASPEIKTAGVSASDTADQKTDEAAAPAPANTEAAKTEVSAAESVTTGETKVEVKADDAKTEVSASDVTKPPEVTAVEARSVEKSGDKVKAPVETGALANDAKKDQARPPNTEKAVATKPDPAAILASKGQISVFVSRKDSKLYVRQNFEPLFDVPVTIKPDDRPLGTHVFTAQVDKDDANVVHWSVVSLPVPARAERRDEDERVSRRRKIAGAVEMKAQPVPDSPAEALDRLNIPADTMARINEALTTGGSIIVSDQGITAGETGEGTDFIVSLR
jgi:lipoprotein-anchoring transpeptidase ErfK/SrfK